MGQLSAANLIATALNKAGDSRLTTPALTWLNAWLRSAYAAWPWPYLQRRIAGLALPAGTQSLSLGAGAGGVTLEIKRVLDPLWVYDSVYSTKLRARIRTYIAGDAFEDESINNPATNIGCPQQFKIRADTSLFGKWSLIPTPVPDKAYLLAVDYIIIPADIVTTTDVPTYPNDRTMIQAILCDALQYMKDKAYLDELQVLASMVIDDRVKFGEVAGTNDQTLLDPSVFR